MRNLQSILFMLAPMSSALAAVPAPYAVTPAVPAQRELFPHGAVRLLPGPFQTMRDDDLAYLLRLEPDRLLAQFRVEAGLEPKAKPYDGWEAPAEPGKTWSLAGHSMGHYLSAASLMWKNSSASSASMN